MTRRRWLGVLLLACASASAASTRAQSAAPPSAPVPVLVLSGASNHDWQWTSASLRAILEESGRFDVSVTFDPATALVDPEALARFRAFVLDYNGPRWGEPAESNFLAAVRAGTGVAVIHAADNAFEGWRAYEELVGDLWRDGTGHGSFHAFDVAIVDRAHPVTRGMADLRAHPDELYHGLVRTKGTAYRVLARAFSDPATGGTGRREPMLFVGAYGAGRVFHTPLGHVWAGHEASRASHEDPAFRDLVVRGVEWAATGAVTERAGAANHLTLWERRAGWRLLFDGRTMRGWHVPLEDESSEHGWTVVDGALRHAAVGGEGRIVSEERFVDFELEFDWSAAPGGTGGVRYRLGGPGSSGSPPPAALELRLDEERAAADRAGGWHHARILAVGEHVEHWLDGTRVLVARSGDAPGASPIVLFGEAREIRFRNVRVREPDRPPGKVVDLLDSASLAGWQATGDASFRRDTDGAIVGEAGGGRRGWLRSIRGFRDFVLELELAVEPPADTDLEFRVGADEEEDDATACSLTSYTLASDAARRAFRAGEWNRCRIECVGPTVRAWMNGIPIVDDVEAPDVEGSIFLDVTNGTVRWRGLRLWDLGERATEAR